MNYTPETPTTGGPASRFLDPKWRMQIYHQGFFDGACFLYAQANAYKALTGKKVGREHWDRALALLPQPARFFGLPGAQGLPYDEAVGHISLLLSAFSDPGEDFAVDQLSPAAGIEEFCAAISLNSVVVFAFGGPTEFQKLESHLVCGVSASDDPVALHLACSNAFFFRNLMHGGYVERHHPDLGRYSNDSIAADSPVVIAPNFRWRITLATRAAGRADAKALPAAYAPRLCRGVNRG